MNVEEIANAVLYEGYALYPYRASSVKNRQRFNFGVLYPRAWSEAQDGADPWSMQTECLFRGNPGTAVSIRIRFLQLKPSEAWQEADPREVSFAAPLTRTFSFPPIEAAVASEVEQLANDIFKIRIQVFNETEFRSGDRNDALSRSLASAHTILTIGSGEFISLLDPPDELRDIAAQCRNVGTWPVLAGEPGSFGAMLSSPIILYDYPLIAPESPGPLFDGTEIDEILTLRIMTLTDEEKREMGDLDERTREILERTESMPPEQFMKLHGVLRSLP